jgi:hypothetical protein
MSRKNEGQEIEGLRNENQPRSDGNLSGKEIRQEKLETKIEACPERMKAN